MTGALQELDALLEALEVDPSDEAAVAELDAVMAALALEQPVESPPAALRERVLASARDAGPFAELAGKLAGMLDVAIARARELLSLAADPSRWEPFVPGVELIHLDGGPTTVGADVGFVKVASGMVFPHHEHGGREDVLVLAGRCRDDDGTVLEPGEIAHKEPGTAHSFEVVEGPFIYAVVVFGLRFTDESIPTP